MKKACRVIVGLHCNYECSYCCNKIPGMMEKFTELPNQKREIAAILNQYESVSISGGEPLAQENQNATWLIRSLLVPSQKLYIYTNGSIPVHAGETLGVAGWSIGFHPSQVAEVDADGRFMRQVARFISMGAQGLRILVEEGVSEMYLKASLRRHYLAVPVKTWKRDDCDKTEIEDWYILKGEK